MVFCVTMLSGARLIDVSYSIKQNGVMINIDYDVPIDDDDIIGWKSDRGWVYLTLLGVRAPQNKSTNRNFKGIVKKIVIDDFDESTQLAILINKPILGYDIINSKGTPGTIVFIHTEMKKSEVAYLKEYIEKKGTSVFNSAKSSGFPKYNTNFKNAFDQARKELGPNAIFEFHGNLYTTNHPGEKEETSNSILNNNMISLDEEIKEKVDSHDKQIEEVYIDSYSGDIITELIIDTLTNNLNTSEDAIPSDKIDPLLSDLSQEDDSWFSGIFPSYKKKKSPFEKNANDKDKVIIKNNAPILVERPVVKKKLNFWKRFFPKDEIKNFVEKKHEKDKTLKPKIEETDFTELQNKFVPSKIKNRQMKLTDEENRVLSQTQLSDTNNVVIEIPLDNFDLEPNYSDYKYLQKKYIPSLKDNFISDTSSSTNFLGSSTQSPDTNVVEAWFTNENMISNEYDSKHLQKKYIPSLKQNLISDTLSSIYFSGSSTQPPDTNVVEAWFTNENMISNEYDPRYLQRQHVPLGANKKSFESPSDIISVEPDPQIPEFTAPFILDDRYKIQYKNKTKTKRNKPRRKIEAPFEPKEKEENTWLSFFPSQSDSIKKKLNWDYKKEKSIPSFLKRETESLDYSSVENKDYSWRTQLPNKRPKSLPSRYSDPGFRYYRQGGITVEANLDGVPIYIDGKYVGDTPLNRPIEVEPGWHQVSGFSPVYTQLAFQKGLQFVGYDSIVQNNEMYGSTTVYSEPGKLETVSLKFNQMGDTPKKMREIEGGMSMGIPMFTLLISIITWAM